MQYLLDSHTFLWFINGDKQLSLKAKKAITSANTVKYISIASFWEIAIKLNLGKLQLDMTFEELIHQVEINGFSILSISLKHTLNLSLLELHHRDPFDRIIITQAISDNLVLISRDNNFQKYAKLNLLW